MIATTHLRPPASSGALARCPKVLVVDDDPFLSRLIVRTIEAEATVVEAHDGLTALDLAERESPDLIILDYHLPHLNGDEVCRRVRAERPAPDLKIVMLTGRGSVFGLAQARDAGADDYLTKPFSPRAILALIEDLAVR